MSKVTCGQCIYYGFHGGTRCSCALLEEERSASESCDEARAVGAWRRKNPAPATRKCLIEAPLANLLVNTVLRVGSFVANLPVQTAEGEDIVSDLERLCEHLGVELPESMPVQAVA